MTSEIEDNNNFKISDWTTIKWSPTPSIDYENKSLEDLKEMRKNINIKEVHPNYSDNELHAYLVRLIDILIERIEKLEKIVNE